MTSFILWLSENITTLGEQIPLAVEISSRPGIN
jgi:hypothetical protein